MRDGATVLGYYIGKGQIYSLQLYARMDHYIV